MNTSSIIEMIKEDPSIVDDIPDFLKRMNEKNQQQVVRTHVEIIDEERMTSTAERCGGEATERNVLDAIQEMEAAPLLEKFQVDFDEIKQAIASGECKDAAEIVTKATEVISRPEKVEDDPSVITDPEVIEIKK